MPGRRVAPALGCSYATLMRRVAENDSPVAFIRIGSRVSFVTADLRRVLHLDGSNNNGAAPNGGPVDVATANETRSDQRRE
jgi:hypothetical protein